MQKEVQEIQDIYADMRGLRHDLRGHINNITQYVKKQNNTDVEELNNYIRNMEETVSRLDFGYQTGNPITDIIIHQKKQEAAWQKSCARIAAQGQVIQGKIFEMPTKEMEELEDSFYQAKDAYMKLYRESRQVGKPFVLQNYIFGNGRMYEVLNRLGNLQERVE